MTSEDLAVVLATSSDAEASVVEALLRSHGIQAVVTSDRLAALASLRGDARPTVRVKVSAELVSQARQIIEASRATTGEGAGCADDARLEAALGYRFRDQGLLEQALTHRSQVHEDPSGGVLDNESLEFLGDAVLGFVVADLLYRECPDRDEGGKSKLKATVVSATTLAEQARVLGLGDHLRLGKGEEQSGGRTKPGLLADAVEAVIAAIYLDGGTAAARAFVERQFLDLIRDVRDGKQPTGLVRDHKSALQEWLQAHDGRLPVYAVAGETGPDHRKTFIVEVRVDEVVVASAEGRSKKDAEQRAAAQALERLGRQR